MHILIIEDEKGNFNRLKRLLEEIDGTFRIDGPLASIVEAVEWLQAHPAPELIFADIRLSDGLSFDVLRRTAVPSPVIFTTAYDQYARTTARPRPCLILSTSWNPSSTPMSFSAPTASTSSI